MTHPHYLSIRLLGRPGPRSFCVALTIFGLLVSRNGANAGVGEIVGRLGPIRIAAGGCGGVLCVRADRAYEFLDVRDPDKPRVMGRYEGDCVFMDGDAAYIASNGAMR